MVTIGIGSILKAERLSTGISAQAMAFRCQISRSHLANMENGHRDLLRHVVVTYGEVFPAVLNRREVIAFLATTGLASTGVLTLDLDAALAADTLAARGADDWEQILLTRARDYMTVGKVGEVRADLFGDLAVLRTSASTAATQRTTALAATLYGQTFAMNNGHDDALGWYRRGIDFADASGDPATQVWCRARAAGAVEHLPGRQTQALRWADEAIAIADKPTTGLVWAHLTRAVLGPQDHASLAREIDLASRAMDRVGCDTGRSDYDIPHWRHTVRVSGILAGVGHPHAQSSITQAAAAISHPGTDHDDQRYGAHLELHQAAVDHGAGDRAGAVQRAKQAVDTLPEHKRSPSMLRHIQDLQTSQRTLAPINLKRFG